MLLRAKPPSSSNCWWRASDYAITLLDADGSILSWNSGAERLLGWEREVAIGEHSSIFLAGSNPREQIAAQLAAARRDGKFSDEVWHRRADGAEFIADVTVRPLPGATDADTRYVKIIHDITAQKASRGAAGRRGAP